jgi:hypothetical protein
MAGLATHKLSHVRTWNLTRARDAYNLPDLVEAESKASGLRNERQDGHSRALIRGTRPRCGQAAAGFPRS